MSVDLAPVRAILQEMGDLQPGDLIPLLQRMEAAYGYVPLEAAEEVSRQTSIPVSRIYGVATFYAQFHLSPRGRHTVRCCRGTACHVRGSKQILDTLKNELGVHEGGTTEDGHFTLEPVACLGTCFLAPVVMVDDESYGRLAPRQLKKILKDYAADGSGDGNGNGGDK